MTYSKFPVRAASADMPENTITERITKCAIAVHRELGPGLLENVYEEALDIECSLDGPVLYKGKRSVSTSLIW